ncbi:hypothetical protein [Brasilonema sp. UFV-L1]|uniref:hypothetical protein n=1 Tax=Brasilonema sp. UFV-L1 TaxID=2234130 RepID=UPI00145E7C3D|nr:hypothetical protein [Brasilonema sp. UFV-L1]NMG06578.1 hypothetical protein [Brasilonema sp. UFV-L1]
MNNLEKTYQVIEEAIKKPPVPHEAQKQSLKAWAMYCLRDRGFKVIYAQNADFAVETRNGDKIYFQVANDASDLDSQFCWIVWDSATKNASLIPAKS